MALGTNYARCPTQIIDLFVRIKMEIVAGDDAEATRLIEKIKNLPRVAESTKQKYLRELFAFKQRCNLE